MIDHKAEAERLRRLAETHELLAEIERTPQDTYSDFDVIRFSKPGKFVGSDTDTLTYAAIKAGGRWFLTGKPTGGFRWASLLEFVGADNFDTIEAALFPSDLLR